jgi:hypothetical protein
VIDVEVHHDTQNICLTSGEIAELFNTYISNKVAVCILSYFNAKVQDTEMKTVLMRSQQLAQRLLEWNEKIFQAENHPVPKGFCEEDVNVNAQKLYSDTFMLTYIRYMSRFSLINYSEARASSTRSDVRAFFDEAIRSNIELFDMADEVLLGKGLLSKPPLIPIPIEIDFAEKHNFWGELVGEKRALNALEANRLFLNHQRNNLGHALLIGFAQTVKDQKIKEYFIRGLGIARKHIDTTASFLHADGLAVPETMAQEVTESKDTAFSDKLMLFHIVTLDSLGFATNGVSLSRVMRADLTVSITKLMGEIALYSKEGMNLLIENNWLEQIPLAKNTKKLLGVH